MRPFLERFISVLTVLLAAFAMAQVAGAQDLTEPGLTGQTAPAAIVAAHTHDPGSAGGR